MKRPTQLVLAILVLAAACTDDKVVEKTHVTSPTRPRLTMSSLPGGASTVCTAAVKERDDLLVSVGRASESAKTRVLALDALVDDTCY